MCEEKKINIKVLQVLHFPRLHQVKLYSNKRKRVNHEAYQYFFVISHCLKSLAETKTTGNEKDNFLHRATPLRPHSNGCRHHSIGHTGTTLPTLYRQ